MTDRMRKALELIASGEGPQGGFLTRVQMIEVARESLAYVRPIPDDLEARLPGYTSADTFRPSLLSDITHRMIAGSDGRELSKLAKGYQPQGDRIGSKLRELFGDSDALLFLAWIKAGGFPNDGEHRPESAEPMIVRDLLK